jgi:glycosyltransferase involved in cell wall biosynthesis
MGNARRAASGLAAARDIADAGPEPSRAAKRLAVVGLSHPLRGGIAHYSTILVRKLRGRHRVDFITFRRQYPRFLFPGRTQRDDSSNPIVEENDAIIDSINPISWFRVAERLRRQKLDLIVFNWWQPFFGLAYGTILQLLPRASRRRVCFLCHNVLPHERHLLEHLLCRYAFRHVPYFIVHSEEDRRKLLQLKPQAQVVRNCHPAYSDFAAGQVLDKARARQQLHLEVGHNVVLFFGLIRPYKGLAYLIRALPAVLREVDCTLLVAGEFYEDKSKYTALVEENGVAAHVRFEDKYIANEDVPSYFCAADVVVLPYVEASQSGIAPLAYAFQKPVITTRVGGLPEAVVDGRTGFLVAPRDPAELARAIIAFYQGGHEQRFRDEIRRQASRFDWDEEIRHLELLIKLADAPAGA